MIHLYNITINQKIKIGNNVTIYYNTTSGSKQFGSKVGEGPKIGNNVLVCLNTCILGNIKIEDNSIIGAEVFFSMVNNLTKKVGSLKQGLKK